MDLQRQLLEELMNPLIPSERKDFRDKDVCKHFLAGFCPAEMFMNTKADLGKCGFVHDAKVQKDYQQSDDKGKLGYEEDFYDYLCRLVSDVDRTIRKGHQRLENKADAPTLAISQDELREKIIIQEETLRTQLEEVLSLGLQSSVKQALDHALLCERLLAELEALRQNDITHHSYKAEKRMEVCEVCGALLANDATGIRIDMHMVGKQHTGFIKIRETIEELKKQGFAGGSRSYGRPRSRSRDRDSHRRDYDRPRNNGGSGRRGRRR